MTKTNKVDGLFHVTDSEKVVTVSYQIVTKIHPDIAGMTIREIRKTFGEDNPPQCAEVTILSDMTDLDRSVVQDEIRDNEGFEMEDITFLN